MNVEANRINAEYARPAPKPKMTWGGIVVAIGGIAVTIYIVFWAFMITLAAFGVLPL